MKQGKSPPEFHLNICIKDIRPSRRTSSLFEPRWSLSVDAPSVQAGVRGICGDSRSTVGFIFSECLRKSGHVLASNSLVFGPRYECQFRFNDSGSQCWQDTVLTRVELLVAPCDPDGELN